MSSRRSVGWLVSLICVVGLGLVAFVALPIRSCPTCRGLAKKLADPATRTLVFRVGCPECNDRGTVSELRFLRGPQVAPQISRLLHSQRNPSGSEFNASLVQVAALSGRNPDEVTGVDFFGRLRPGLVRFVRAEGKPFILVMVNPPGENRAGFILLGLDGSVLDFLYCSCSVRWGYLVAATPDDPCPDGAVAALEGRRDQTADLPADVRVGYSGPGADHLRNLAVLKEIRIAVKSQRFAVSPAR